MSQVARHSTPKPVLPAHLEERFAEIDRRSAECYRDIEKGMVRLELISAGEDNEGKVSAAVIGDTAVHHLRLAASAGRQLIRGEGDPPQQT